MTKVSGAWCQHPDLHNRMNMNDLVTILTQHDRHLEMWGSNKSCSIRKHSKILLKACRYQLQTGKLELWEPKMPQAFPDNWLIEVTGPMSKVTGSKNYANAHQPPTGWPKIPLWLQPREIWSQSKPRCHLTRWPKTMIHHGQPWTTMIDHELPWLPMNYHGLWTTTLICSLWTCFAKWHQGFLPW